MLGGGRGSARSKTEEDRIIFSSSFIPFTLFLSEIGAISSINLCFDKLDE